MSPVNFYIVIAVIFLLVVKKLFQWRERGKEGGWVSRHVVSVSILSLERFLKTVVISVLFATGGTIKQQLYSSVNPLRCCFIAFSLIRKRDGAVKNGEM